MTPIAETDRLQDLRLMLARGNHKSALDNIDKVTSMLQDEVHHMWQLPLPPRAALELPGAVIAPVGLADQLTINEHGEIVPKQRLTHDQSYNVVPGTKRSVNDRIDFESLTPCRYGHALLRFIHVIISLRLLHPCHPILLTKVDLKSAYRRLHYTAAMAVQACVLVCNLLLVALRLTFGGAANPSQWSDVSELAFDLANDLIRNPGWDPAQHHSPHQHLLADRVEMHSTEVPFAPAYAVCVPYPTDDQPKCDGYLDDGFMAFLLRDRARGAAILPFIIYLLGRPVHEQEAKLREDLLSITKFLGEATPAEYKTILGWRIDTRCLLISLPEDKFIGWCRDIEQLLAAPKVTAKQLEVTVGRLNHVGFIIPMARHFLSRLRQALYSAQHRRKTSLRPAQRADLRLWLRFLKQANDGINLNLLTYRAPTRILRTDACLHGIGGYNLQSGKAWRWELPPDLRDRATLNTLEFMSSYVGLYMEYHLEQVAPLAVVLSQTDSTSAAGWLRKSNFDDDKQPIQLEIARAMATLVMDGGFALFSQWFPGSENDVADSLSRDTDLPCDQLTHLLSSSVPTQVPPGFNICPLPPKLCSQLETWLLKQPKSTLSPSQPVRSKLRTGPTTSSSYTTSSSTPTPSSPSSSPGSSIASWVPSLPPTVAGASVPPPSHPLGPQSAPNQFEPPWTQWLRPSGITTISAPSTTPSPHSSSSFYNAS
jgi:hypothetical protein